MSGALALEGRDLKRSYRRSHFALDVPRVEAPAGGTLALLGPSGSGKTTLLRLLGLLEAPDAGEVLVGGRPATLSSREVRLSMAAVFQRPYLFKGSVAENVGYGLKVRGVRGTERTDRVAAALERVGLAGYEERSAASLSGGESQRVSLARALVLEPRVLLLDEPLASLDPLLKRRLSQDFSAILHETDTTVVYVTHDQDEALVVADHVAVMNEGRIVASGPAEEIAGLAEDEWTASFMGVEPASRGTVVAAEGGLSTVALAPAPAAGATLAIAGELAPGTGVLVSVRPEDVLLFEAGAELPLTTARNRLEAQVTAVEPRGSTLRVTLDAKGMRLASSVSRASAAELGLVKGASTVAVFKATAVRWRRVEPEDGHRTDRSEGPR